MLRIAFFLIGVILWISTARAILFRTQDGDCPVADSELEVGMIAYVLIHRA